MTNLSGGGSGENKELDIGRISHYFDIAITGIKMCSQRGS